MHPTTLSFVAASAALTLAACASSPSLPAGVKPGEFARMTCDGGKTFAVRVSEDGRSARVRGHHGAAELAAKGDGLFEGEGYRLMLKPGEGSALSHDGKPQGEKCRPQA
jgi:hypothetical protein